MAALDSRHAVTLAALWAACAPALAFAEPPAFTRVGQTAGIDGRELVASYGVDGSRGVVELRGDGTGGRGDFRGVTHRLAVGVGVTRWLTLGAEQSVKQESTDDLAIGVFAPEIRLRLDRLAARVPTGLALTAGGRVRVKAQRDSSLTAGLAFDRPLGAFDLVSAVAYEVTTVSQPEHGLRYQVGVGHAVGTRTRLALEGWGAVTRRPDASPLRQDHHAGPSVHVALGRWLLGAGVGVGFKRRPRADYVDATAMVRLAMGW